MEHHDAQAQQREIQRLRGEVAEAEMRRIMAEQCLRHALKALEVQAETLDLVTRNVTSILSTINSGVESGRKEGVAGELPGST